jgi:sortase A
MAAFADFKAAFTPEIVATLELPSRASQIPVFSGVNEINMTLGAAHLEDSAALDSDGNIALTAHRDGSFRILKDVRIDELIVLHSNDTRKIYKVVRSNVVPPEHVDVLKPTSVPTLTLITCHPFYFVGSAPNRYVLQAELISTEKDEALSFTRRSPDTQRGATNPPMSFDLEE